MVLLLLSSIIVLVEENDPEDPTGADRYYRGTV
jgi:hypothetical protein